MCTCDTNYGSEDCSVNLMESPIFQLAETCCDSITMNCDKLYGVGPMFSNNDTLFYRLELVGDYVSSEDANIYSNEATVLDTKRFEIKYPFGFLKNIRLSNVTMRVGIGYGRGNFSYQNVSFYDSNCRTCSNGLVDPETVILFCYHFGCLFCY